MRNQMRRQVARARDTVRSGVNRSAHWVSLRTTAALDAGEEEPRFSFSSSYGPWTGFSLPIDDETIWLGPDEEERVFDEKLQTFLELEHGKQPARAWLLNGS